MPTKNIAPTSDPVEEVPITETAAENKEPMPGRVAKRPFVLENRRGSAKGNMTMMITVVGVILLFGIGMLALLSSTKTMKKKTHMEAAKPNLGHVQTGSASGDLIPSNKVKSSPEESANRANVDPNDIERTKAPKMAEPQMQISSASRTAKGGGRLAD